MNITQPKRNDLSPWGRIDSDNVIADGIVFVNTPSHGGMWISQSRRDAMPEPFRSPETFAGGNWFEEDCDATRVVLSFPDLFKPEQVSWAKAVLFGKNKGIT